MTTVDSDLEAVQRREKAAARWWCLLYAILGPQARLDYLCLRLKGTASRLATKLFAFGEALRRLSYFVRLQAMEACQASVNFSLRAQTKKSQTQRE